MPYCCQGIIMITLTIFVVFSLVCMDEGSYDIYRSPCRRNAVFKITEKGRKISVQLIKVHSSKSLASCLKHCLDISNCKSFNFKPNALQNDCELLESTRASGSLVGADGWNHYEPVSQSVSPLSKLLMLCYAKIPWMALEKFLKEVSSAWLPSSRLSAETRTFCFKP